MTIEIKGAVTSKIGFASHQNAVPILRELELVSGLSETVEHLELRLSSDPSFLEPKCWPIDRLAGQSTLHITDRDLKLTGGFLGDLTECVTGEVRVSLEKDGETLASQCFPVELLARAEWGGAGVMPELLAAFAMPNDPAVDRILKAASDVLRRAGKPDQIDGYESKSRTRVWQLASAIWSAVAGFGISYALPPASFEAQGQKVRTPGAILDGRVATCLDTALLFAAAIEQAGLNPMIILTKGHAFVGVWLQPQEFSQLITDDGAAVRKRFDLDELLIFETTLVTHAPAPAFDQAVAVGRRHVAEDKSADFVMAIDIHRARMQRIRPLAVDRAQPASSSDPDAAEVAEALLDAPVLPDFDIEVEAATATPADRVMQWQRKLLDLTTRNRLLHLPEGAKAVSLLCPDPELLEDRLASGAKIKIASLPDLEAGGRDTRLYEQQTAENLLDQYARAALERGEVLSALDKTKLEASLIDLYRKANSDLNEGGANTLFLSVGFLKWKKSADDPKHYRAPLILVPVKLDRKSALSGVVLKAHEDEPRFNLTLLELLRQDFDLKIPGLDGTLPGDESGVDVARVWTMVRKAVRDIPGFEVVEDVAIGTFSFAKYLMWKDLADRADQLKQSPVVRHLIERGSEAFCGGGEFVRPEDLDRRVDPSALFAPLPADSSQLSAVVASANGCDFVLDGPPGTGKSQTIANMIAHNLALGRRVLFVAEKMAALDVVYRRLEEKGLGEFCLELHSNKTSKVDVLKQLERAWDVREQLTADEWAREAADVRRLRDGLNEVVRLLHARQSNGMTLHDAIGRVVRDADESTPRLAWPEGTEHDVDTLAHLRDIARRLGLAARAIGDLPAEFAAIARTSWSNAWQDSVVSAARELPQRLDMLIAARDRLLETTRLPLTAEDEPSLAALANLVGLMIETHGQDLRFAFTPDFADKAGVARRAITLIIDYRALETELSVAYAPEAARRLPLAQFDAEWRASDDRWWIFATLAKRRVAKSLAAQGGAGSPPDVAADLPRLNRLHDMLVELDALAPAMTGMPGWASLGSDTARIEQALDLAERLRARITAMAACPDDLVALRGAVAHLVVDANEMLGPEAAIAVARARLSVTLPAYNEAAERVAELTQSSSTSRGLISERAFAAAVVAHAPRLNAWCNWRRVRDEAVSANLAPLVTLLETHGMSGESAVDLFDVAYARWFAAALIDDEPRLAEFVAEVHMSDIEAYRKLDDRLSRLSVRYIRAQLCGRIPDKSSVGKKDGYGILKHQLQLQRRHKPVRQLAVDMGEALTTLAPCMLMSPLSIAQYLPTDQALFDLVIFDEASQIAPWDAIGSIARGRQVVIAGDPRQMPPTSFFNRAAGAADDDADTEEDMESILDECLGAGVPQHSLAWHYRSRHESLIAFSNNRYYDSRLITFPAPVTRDSAVSWRKVDGVYAKGKARTNQAEAEAMVAEVVKRLTDPAFVEANRTLAIVTLNSDQQKLVEDLLDQARRKHPRIERFFGEEMTEPVIVKNLETVQGDERDLILLGIGYGPTDPGSPTMSMNFGPLNREGGWRRLNVAVTRARREMILFTSFDPGMVDLNRTGARAVRDLKHFLEFADRGPRALAEAVQGSVGGHESPFEEAVAAALVRKGWTVVPQIGVSRFRIDLGIVHPDHPGDYLVGIECDGAAYHSGATARDRDKVRASILEGLGWSLLRVWSTEWWVDKAGATERLHAAIEQRLAAARLVESERSQAQDMHREIAQPTEQPDESSDVDAIRMSGGETADDVAEPPSVSAPTFAQAIEFEQSHSPYRAVDFTALTSRIDPAAFYAPGYDATLATMIAHVLEQEAPIAETLLVTRIARAHGFLRCGRIIRERVMTLAAAQHHVERDGSGGAFVWADTTSPAVWRRYRIPATQRDIRQIEEIAVQELRAAAAASAGEDTTVDVARLFGIRRLSTGARRRIQEAISLEPSGMAAK